MPSVKIPYSTQSSWLKSQQFITDGVVPKNNNTLQVAGVPAFIQMAGWKDAKVFCFLMRLNRLLPMKTNCQTQVHLKTPLKLFFEH